MSTSKGLNSLNQKVVYDITKFTTTDYAGCLSCVVWFVSCNFKCPYCYNDSLVFSRNGKYCLNDVLEFLKTRIGLLDAVVISGGEASLHSLVPFCKEVKKLGFKIKLDTNGTNLKLIKDLISLNLLDYLAIDFKAHKDKFYLLTKTNLYDKFLDTVKYLIKINFNFELRTTINTSLLDENDINKMIKILKNLGYKNTYYLQNFIQTSSNIGNIKQARQIDKTKIDTQGLVIKWRN